MEGFTSRKSCHKSKRADFRKIYREEEEKKKEEEGEDGDDNVLLSSILVIDPGWRNLGIFLLEIDYEKEELRKKSQTLDLGISKSATPREIELALEFDGGVFTQNAAWWLLSKCTEWQDKITDLVTIYVTPDNNELPNMEDPDHLGEAAMGCIELMSNRLYM